MYSRVPLTKRTIIIIASILAFFLLASLVFYFLNRTVIAVTTEPQGAEVYLDSSVESVGQSPLEITNIKRSTKYTITARKEGLLDTSVGITTTKAKQAVHIQLIEPIAITSVAPKENERDVDINTKIAATFAENVPQEELEFVFAPAIIGTIEKDQATKTLIFNPSQPLPRNIRYEIRLIMKKVNGSSIVKSWSFISKEYFGEEAFDQKAIEQLKIARDRAIKAYDDRKKRIPFLTKLPFTSVGHFKVEITASSDIIYITTPNSLETYKNEALVWIRTNGGDPSKLTIEYRIGGV